MHLASKRCPLTTSVAPAECCILGQARGVDCLCDAANGGAGTDRQEVRMDTARQTPTAQEVDMLLVGVARRRESRLDCSANRS